jgi:UDP-N-acetylmuramate dehydrogenase
MPYLVLGGGSNIVFTRDFSGLVLHMATKGIAVVGEDADFTYVRAAAGEDWHAFVNWTLDRGLGGLENLSLIPGSVGASPVQNIGAYGAELSDCFYALTLFDFESGETKTMNKAECAFGYRDSIFKHAMRDRCVILDVTFALPKRWQANTTYADVSQELAARGIVSPTARDVSDAVTVIRKRKLPDPLVLGNAGSFFKNPVVSAAVKDALVKQYPQLVSYPEKDGSFKLAAGWLVDQSGWKGKTSGHAGVSETQALVLVNRGAASGQDVIALAQAIQKDVAARFGVALDIEPTVI